tara:strand:+ start:1013 stop:1429 length:417 start_codon:yes stop_codon:yes gene_type:complete
MIFQTPQPSKHHNKTRNLEALGPIVILLPIEKVMVPEKVTTGGVLLVRIGQETRANKGIENIPPLATSGLRKIQVIKNLIPAMKIGRRTGKEKVELIKGLSKKHQNQIQNLVRRVFPDFFRNSLVVDFPASKNFIILC